MIKKFKNTYSFSAVTSAYITVFLTFATGFAFYFFAGFHWGLLLVFGLLCYAISFFIIQYRTEKYIYRSVKKIYDDVNLLDASTLARPQITTDMKTLTKEVERFAQDKRLEIQTLLTRDNYRKEFIGNVSHELKTPLFTVQSYILTLLDGAMKDKKVRKKYLQRAEKGVERLIYIVKDLDMISKLEVGGLHLKHENFNMIEVVQNVFDLFEMKAEKKNITLTFDKKYSEGVFVNADKERIEQVLANLIVNSIKYGKPDGTTEVSLETLVKNRILVRVTDNGEGMEQKHIPRIFERFYRIDKSGSRKEGGSGLGLSIVKHILEAHNEKIYVETQLGIGSEFSFTLKRAE